MYETLPPAVFKERASSVPFRAAVSRENDLSDSSVSHTVPISYNDSMLANAGRDQGLVKPQIAVQETSYKVVGNEIERDRGKGW